MPTSAIKALATLTLGSTASTVTFSSIVGTYKDLRLVVSATNSTTSTNLRIQYNSDTGANYAYVLMNGDGSATSSTNNLAIAYALSGENYVAESMQTIDILDYSATDKHKTALVRNNRPAGGVTATVTRWANTAAITSFIVYPGASTFAAGSTFTLYGVSA
jgi:hypothetical protein